jgi:hypothetical protein
MVRKGGRSRSEESIHAFAIDPEWLAEDGEKCWKARTAKRGMVRGEARESGRGFRWMLCLEASDSCEPELTESRRYRWRRTIHGTRFSERAHT